MNPLLQGYWKTTSAIADIDEIFHISASGVYVHQVVLEVDPIKYFPMRLRLEQEGGDKYRVRHKQNAEGWSVVIKLNNNDLVIERVEKVIRCKRMKEEDVPEWFKIELEKAHLKMEAEQGN